MSLQESRRRLIWPRNHRVKEDMSYRAISLLDRESDQQTFGDKHTFVVTCSNDPSTYYEPFGAVHKVEATALPNYSQAQFKITHEVLPGLGCATHVLDVNRRLRIVGFQTGTLVSVTNFGPRKTFSCDVNGRFSHHAGEISCLAANSAGTKFVSGCTTGTINLYQAREARVEFLRKLVDTRVAFVSDMQFYQPNYEFPYGSMSRAIPRDDSILLYTSNTGRIAHLDTRCGRFEAAYRELMLVTEPRINITSFTTLSTVSDNILYLGARNGEILTSDLRLLGRFVDRVKMDDDACITKLREISLIERGWERSYLAYMNGTDQLKILEPDTMAPSEHWKCELDPSERIRDYVQVKDKLVTCGDKTSFGCWAWEKPEAVSLFDNL